jgi:hypothetical protein
MRPPSADGWTARRAPARNFSTSRAASAHRSQKSRWPAAQNLYIQPQNLCIQPPPAAGLYIQLCIFLAVEGLWCVAAGPAAVRSEVALAANGE